MARPAVPFVELAGHTRSSSASMSAALLGAGLTERLPVPALVALAFGAGVLGVCAFLMARATADLPAWSLFRRFRRSTKFVPRPRGRGAVTGARLTMSDVPSHMLEQRPRRAVTGPSRQLGLRPDVLPVDANVVAAERTIEHLLDTDPDALAGIIMQWLDEDQQADDEMASGHTGRTSRSGRSSRSDR